MSKHDLVRLTEEGGVVVTDPIAERCFAIVVQPGGDGMSDLALRSKKEAVGGVRRGKL